MGRVRHRKSRVAKSKLFFNSLCSLSQFGSKFNENGTGGHDKGSFRQTQSAPDSFQSRSHKLFESLSSACSFNQIPYIAELPVKPRCAFISALYSSKGLKYPPIYSPATLTLHKGIITFACSPRTMKRYDIGTVPSKDKKKIIMALASTPDPERCYPLAMVKVRTYRIYRQI